MKQIIQPSPNIKGIIKINHAHRVHKWGMYMTTYLNRGFRVTPFYKRKYYKNY